MKRDLDLSRQLLLEIENRGPDCSVSVLHTGSDHAEEKIRYHLRLLIDAGLLKEIDRTSEGMPCVRLTHNGHELLELVRSQSRWREAKWACQDRMGGLSLTVIRGILLRWAMRQRRPYAAHALPQSAYRVEPYRLIERREERDAWDEENVRYVRIPAEREEFRHRWGIDGDGDERGDGPWETVLPAEVI